MIAPTEMSSVKKIAIDNRKSKRSAEENDVSGLSNSMHVADDAEAKTNSKLPVAILMITDAIDEFDCEIPSAKRLKENSEIDASHDTCAMATELMQKSVGSGTDAVLTYDDLNYSPPINDISTALKTILQEDDEKTSHGLFVSKELTQLMLLEETESSSLLSSGGPLGISECAPIAEIAVLQDASMIQSPDGDVINESSNDTDLMPILQSADDLNQIDALMIDHPDDCHPILD